jgi:hypothetical protein
MLETERDLVAKKLKVVDMMLTAHSVLAQRNAWRSEMLDLLLIALSILLCLTALLDPSVLQTLSLGPEPARIALAVLSSLVFFLSLVQWRVDWKSSASEHVSARTELIELKREAQQLMISPVSEEGDFADREWLRDAAATLGRLKPIPERQFAGLKARHYRKIELSKLVGDYPGVPIPILRVWLTLLDSRRLAAHFRAESSTKGDS